jgi:hypothetical protein
LRGVRMFRSRRMVDGDAGADTCPIAHIEMQELLGRAALGHSLVEHLALALHEGDQLPCHPVDLIRRQPPAGHSQVPLGVAGRGREAAR